MLKSNVPIPAHPWLARVTVHVDASNEYVRPGVGVQEPPFVSLGGTSKVSVPPPDAPLNATCHVADVSQVPLKGCPLSAGVLALTATPGGFCDEVAPTHDAIVRGARTTSAASPSKRRRAILHMLPSCHRSNSWLYAGTIFERTPGPTASP